MLEKNIKEVLNKMSTVPSMPPVISEALNIMENPKTNINRLSLIISKDIALTTEILKMVNSAYYGFPSQITTINRAMALLGMNKVKSLIMSVAVKPMMMSHCGKSLWEHSIRCAVGCQIISKSIDNLDADEAFIMGLLHDIGKTVLNIYNKDASNEIAKLVKIGADGLAAEKMMFGFTHTELGQELVSRWKLPSLLSSCVRYHHNPLDAEDKNIMGVIYVADKVSQEQCQYPMLDHDIIENLDFDISDPGALRESIFTLSKPILEALSH